jgi:DNA-binding response OmpR family regulator
MRTAASILIVDDQPDLVENIGMTLEGAGHQVLIANDGIEALEIMGSKPVDLVLADIAMPGMNGYQLFERVRENPQWITIPFLFLTARSLDSDIRYGKELGVDDYLTKPIQPEDLLASVHGKLRRARLMAQSLTSSTLPPTPEHQPLIVGRLQIDPSQHRVWLDKQEIQLTAKEFLLLEYLARQAGKVVSSPELIQATHQLDTDPIEAASLLGPILHALRRKLSVIVGNTEFIANVRGVGYRLITPND